MQENISSSNKIAKNTLFLYLRQLFSLIVSLYTVRALLSVLGVEDYGIFNVVGGVVTMFGFLSSTMSTSTQRYISFEIGKSNNSDLEKIFSISFETYIFIAIFVFVLCETLGLWFLNTHMAIAVDRIFAANIVYQSVVVSFLITVLCTPYNAAVISKEDMSIFAYVGIAETILRLIIVLITDYISFWSDNLIIYSILLLLTIGFTQFYYTYYCKKHYLFCNYRRKYKDIHLMKSMLSFAGWNIIGSLSNVLRSQGINILINVFFGPTVNAARGVAFQVNNAINSFSNNFYAAVRPQIIKGYAAKQTGKFEMLITFSSKVSFYLMIVLIIPISLNADYILKIWLNEVPEYTIFFLQLALLNAVLEVYSMPLVTGIQATGSIKKYQIIVSCLYLLNLPISYILLSIGYPPQTTVIVNIILVVVALIPRLLISKYKFGLNLKRYVSEVLGVTITTGIVCYILSYTINNIMIKPSNIYILLLSCLLISLFNILSIILIGTKSQERMYVWSLIKSKL